VRRASWWPARASAASLACVVLLAACGGDGRREEPAPQRAVRSAASGYVDALAGGDFGRACRMMTASARRALSDAAGTCASALRDGAASAAEDVATVRREVAGAEIRICGSRATIGPFGAAERPLRLERVGGHWLVAG
jgi:hypothetical protein